MSTRLDAAIRKAIGECQPASPEEAMNGTAAAIAMVVSYGSMQRFLETLAACADAKEHVRAIDAGEVADLN